MSVLVQQNLISVEKSVQANQSVVEVTGALTSELSCLGLKSPEYVSTALMSNRVALLLIWDVLRLNIT